MLLGNKQNKLKDREGESKVVTTMKKKKMIRGNVVLMKKNFLGFNEFHSSLLDGINEFFGNGISFQLISVVNPDPENEWRGKLGKEAYLENWTTTYVPVAVGEAEFKITFVWEVEDGDDSIGVPGAFIK